MLTATLFFQIVIILLIVVLAIIGHRKLNERRVKIECEPVIYYEDKLFSDKVVAGDQVHFSMMGFLLVNPRKK